MIGEQFDGCPVSERSIDAFGDIASGVVGDAVSGAVSVSLGVSNIKLTRLSGSSARRDAMNCG